MYGNVYTYVKNEYNAFGNARKAIEIYRITPHMFLISHLSLAYKRLFLLTYVGFTAHHYLTLSRLKV